MAADVVHHPDCVVRSAHCYHRQTGQIGDDMVAGAAQLRDVRDQLPAAVEDRAAVGGCHLRSRVEARGQGGGGCVRLRGEVGLHAPSIRAAAGKEGRRAPAFHQRVRIEDSEVAALVSARPGSMTRAVLPTRTVTDCTGSMVPSLWTRTTW